MSIEVPQEHEAHAKYYRMGYNSGHGIACHNVPTFGRVYFTESEGRVTVDADNIRDVHTALCFEAESAGRDFSPFEFTASEINSLDEAEEGSSEDAWAAYDAGVSDAIHADISTYDDEDYGIPYEDEEE